MIHRKSKMAKANKKSADDASARERVRKIIARLDKEHPDAKLALNYTNPLELLIALILAACVAAGVLLWILMRGH